MMRRSIIVLQSLRGKLRIAVVLLLGALAALSMAPVHFSPVLFISFPGFFLVLDASLQSKTPRQQFWMAMWLGWCFGFGFFLSGLWWIGAAVLVDGPTFVWALPFAVAGIPAILAIFWALATAAALLFWQSNTLKIVSLVFFFSFAEYLRGFVLTGFPWNSIGYGAMPTVLFMQSASVVGLWGVTTLTLLAAFSPALLVVPNLGWERQRAIALLVFVAFSLVAHISYGSIRLYRADIDAAIRTPHMLRLLQPNISQQDKWRAGNEEAVFQTYLEMSAAPGLSDIDALIWPESAFPFLILQRPDALARIDALLPKNVKLLTGAVRIKPPDTRFTDTPPKLKFFNALIEFNEHAQPVGFYNKQHLVPFGEFIPFEQTAERFGITKLVNLPGGFAKGVDGNLMRFNEAQSSKQPLPPAQILICYEAIFPNFSQPIEQLEGQPVATADPAQWILNVTNDAWFGQLAGPYQHFHQSRLRAVEEGLPMIRVANTGISAVIDSFGRIERSLPLGTAGIIDTALPSAAPATVQSRYRDIPFAIFMLFLGLLLLAGRMLMRPKDTI